MAKKIRVESTSVFSSLPWWVARDEGLFLEEGVEVEFIKVERNRKGTNHEVTDWNLVASNKGHAGLQERGGADLYWACEWGNYRRAQDSTVGGRQVGRRAAVACAALIVPPCLRSTRPSSWPTNLLGFPSGPAPISLHCRCWRVSSPETSSRYVSVTQEHQAGSTL